MSLVHDGIAAAGLSVQQDEVKKLFEPYWEDYKNSSWYPDRTNEVKKTMSEEICFLYPEQPEAEWQRKLVKISRESKFWSWCGNPPLDYLYLCEHYLQNAVDSIKAQDIKSAVKFLGVYSHVIADVIEPGHAVFDWAIDIFAPGPEGIFTNKERLSGPAVHRQTLWQRMKLVEDCIKEMENGVYGTQIEAKS